MNRVEAILTIDTESIPDNFQEILKHEQEVVALWRQQGFLEHFFLRQTRNGAVFIFKDIEVDQVKEMMATLPLYKFKKNLEYLPLIQQF